MINPFYMYIKYNNSKMTGYSTEDTRKPKYSKCDGTIYTKQMVQIPNETLLIAIRDMYEPCSHKHLQNIRRESYKNEIYCRIHITLAQVQCPVELSLII